jgi:hypothetical protein
MGESPHGVELPREGENKAEGSLGSGREACSLLQKGFYQLISLISVAVRGDPWAEGLFSLLPPRQKLLFPSSLDENG